MSNKRNKLSCAMMAQNPQSQVDNQIQFKEEVDEWNLKWEKNDNIVTYCLIKDTKDILGDSLEKRAVNLAMDTWNVEIPLELQSVNKDQNPDIRIEFTDSNDDWFKVNPSLAYAHFPGTENQGTIKFNDDYYWSLDGKPKPSPDDPTGKTIVSTYNFLHTLIHEIGHGLGLPHAKEDAKDSVMYYNYNGRLDLSKNDIERIVEKYRKREWTHEGQYERRKKVLGMRVRDFDKRILKLKSIT